MDQNVIRTEFSKIKGRKFKYDEEMVYVEELVMKDPENPQVMLSNDSVISLTEAVNYVEMTVESSSNQNEESEKHGGAFFPNVKYDENGIPILENVARNQDEIEEVYNKFSETTKQSDDPITILVSTAKKQPATFSLEFEAELINSRLYSVLKESYDIVDVNKVLIDSITNQLTDKIREKVEANLDKILSSK
jgi:hypothetical protein